MQRLRKNRQTAKRRPSRQWQWGLLILLLAAAIPRFWGISAKALWLDEIMTVQKASMPYPDMIAAIKQHDAHPPLYQSIEWLWLRLGRGDGFARIPSVIAGIAAVWLAYLLARRLFSRQAGTISAALMAFSYFHIYYSQEARLHALIIPLVLGQAWLLLRILHQRGRAHWGWWAGYGLIALASLYTYALCLLTIAAFGLTYLLLSRKHRRWQLPHIIVVHLLVALLFLPWYPNLRATTAGVRASVKSLHDEKPAPTVNNVLDGAAAWAIGPLPWPGMRPWGVVLGGSFILIAGAGILMRRAKRPAKILAVLFLLPLLAYILMPLPRVHTYDAKHLIFLQPILLIALAGFRPPIRRCGLHAGKAAVYLALLLLAVNAWFLSDYYHKNFQKENWPAVVSDVRSQWQEGDALVFNPELMGAAFDYYTPPEERELVKQRTILGIPLNPEWRYRYKLLRPNGPPLLPSPDIRRVWVIECKNHVVPRTVVYDLLRDVGFIGFTSTGNNGQRYYGHLGYVQWLLFTRAQPMGSHSP